MKIAARDIFSTVGKALFSVFLSIACAISILGFGASLNHAYADEQISVIAKIGRVVAQKIADLNIPTPTEAPLTEAPLSKASFTEAPLQDVDYTTHVGELLQNDIMVAGCELVSLEIALESMGIEVDLDALVEEYLDMNGSFATGYAGDPYWDGGGFPPGITAAANGYLQDHGQAIRAYDITGSSFDTLSNYISHGYPVLVWTTMEFEDPYYTGEFDDDIEWYSNEHCVVLYGFTENGEFALVSDPLEGLVERETTRFVDIYEQCGSRAVILR